MLSLSLTLTLLTNPKSNWHTSQREGAVKVAEVVYKFLAKIVIGIPWIGQNAN